MTTPHMIDPSLPCQNQVPQSTAYAACVAHCADCNCAHRSPAEASLRTFCTRSPRSSAAFYKEALPAVHARQPSRGSPTTQSPARFRCQLCRRPAAGASVDRLPGLTLMPHAGAAVKAASSGCFNPPAPVRPTRMWASGCSHARRIRVADSRANACRTQALAEESLRRVSARRWRSEAVVCCRLGFLIAKGGTAHSNTRRAESSWLVLTMTSTAPVAEAALCGGAGARHSAALDCNRLKARIVSCTRR